MGFSEKGQAVIGPDTDVRVTHTGGKLKVEPVTPIYIAWLKNNLRPDLPWAQIWHDDYSNYPEHKAAMSVRLIYKEKVKWEHRFLGIENMKELYPYKAPAWYQNEIGVKSSPSTSSAEAPPEPSKS